MANEQDSFVKKASRFLAAFFWLCVVACVSSCLIAATLKFIMWMFGL